MTSQPEIPELHRPMAVERREEMATKMVPAAQPGSDITDLSGGLLGVIARAARDPSVDIDKMERLMEMQERVIAREAKTAYAIALAELQPRLPIITERGKILNNSKQVQSTYAYWEDVNEEIRPLLAEHGFSLSFRTGRAGADITVTGVLTHREGHSEETTIALPSDGSGNKNAVQAVASSTSYGKRYTAFALLNITTKGEDDDGQSATKYQASGEPMPRAKLDGPHESKTALRTAVNAVIAAVRTVQSVDALEALLTEHKRTINQARRDWPALIDGDPKVPEDIGFKGAVEQARAALDDTGMVGMMIDSMKACQTLHGFNDWMDRNETAIATLDGADCRRFERERDAFEAGLKVQANVRAG